MHYGACLFMSKTARHKAILDLLDEGPVESQDSLQQRLERRGFDVGQATLSRDIHELKLVKGPDGYQRAGENSGSDSVLPSVMHLARQFVVDIRQAQNLLVVKTTVGSAQPVAAALDASHWTEVVGTLAGDDTVLVIASDNKKAQTLARRISELS
jgi:transcriptional regulator of arginine metabolism